MPDPDEFDDESDGQDLAEVFDEENITPDGRDIATSDMEPDLFDVTSVEEDADAALAPDEDFDPDGLDEAEWEEIVMTQEDADRRRRDPGDRAPDEGAEQPESASMEPDALADDDIEELGYDDAQPALDQEDLLDEALAETFPASDPVSITPRVN